MTDDQSRLGSLIATVGAVVLGVSVFLPWYALSWTADGASFAAQQLNGAAQQYGNSAFQGIVGGLAAHVQALAGHRIGSVSAHDALKTIGWLLLILAAITFVLSLARVAGTAGAAESGRGITALAGLAAIALVLFRIADRPGGGQDLISVSLGAGAWLALLSAGAVLLGSLWPDGEREEAPAPAAPVAVPASAWDEMAGWTPGPEVPGANVR